MSEHSVSERRVRVLVADDEDIALKGLCALLETDTDIEIVARCTDGAQAVDALRALTPDLAFLDVQMPVLDGFGVLRAIEGDHVPVIVFVTAYDRYALNAFDVYAVDYVLKPFEDERFHLALARAKEHVAWRANGEPSLSPAAPVAGTPELAERLARFLDAAEQVAPHPASQQQFPSRLVVRANGRIRFVRTRDLSWIEAADYYVKLHVGGKVHMLRESMTSLEQRLDPGDFFRVHRSALVHLDHVREIQLFARTEYVVILDDNTRLPLIQTRREELARRLGDRL